MTPIRERAKEILNVVKPEGQQIPSSTLGLKNGGKGNNPEFERLTRVSHQSLWNSWMSSPDNMRTTCMDFVGWYSQELGKELGLKENLGRFDIEAILPKIGKAHSWVKSTGRFLPKYGDILRHKETHMDVALDFEGPFLVRAASGQGGPWRDKVTRELLGGVDIIERTRRRHGKPPEPYDSTKLQGWVDIDVYYAPGTQLGQVPQWLLGWWTVTWRGQLWYYYYTPKYEVYWTQNQWDHTATDRPPTFINDTGAFAVSPQNGVVIRWSATGSVEQFSTLAGNVLMQGTWNGVEPLAAAKTSVPALQPI